MDGRRKLCCSFFCMFYGVALLLTIVIGEPLYSDKDDIVILNTQTFNQTVLGTSNAWLVEFYSSWCGHCIRYAPVYKQLATDVKGWRSVILLAAIDCADETNGPVCREYNIHQYPTIAWLPAHSVSSLSVVNIDHVETADGQRQIIIDSIQAHFDIRIVSRNNIRIRQMLAPLTDIEDIWKRAMPNTKQCFVIVESKESYIGREVILDLVSYSELIVTRMVDAKFKEEPGRYVVTKNVKDNVSQLNPIIVKPGRKQYVAALLDMLKMPMDGLPRRTTIGLGADWLSRNSTGDSDPRVHQQDLESGLHYSLRHEVALYSTIEGEQLAALSVYLEALAKFLPVRPAIQSFLQNLHSWLIKQQSLSGTDWLRHIEKMQTETSYLPESLRWTGCRGSQVMFRGYPCSLWMTFHTLLASATASQAPVVSDNPVDARGNKHLGLRMAVPDKSMNARQVLLAIRGYVKYFFGCRECVENFMRGAVRIEQTVHTDDDAVLFLWRSHNKANYHLQGDATEDPEHPKVQFPTVAQCAACHVTVAGNNSDRLWNERAVAAFLRRMYDASNILPDSEMGRDEKTSRGGGSSSFTATLLDVFVQRNKTWDGASVLFSRLDVSICLAFNLVCSGVIGLLYCRFCRRCRLRKFGGKTFNVV